MPMGKSAAEKDSALQLLGEVCLQPLRSRDSTPSAGQPHAPETDVQVEQEVRAYTAYPMRAYNCRSSKFLLIVHDPDTRTMHARWRRGVLVCIVIVGLPLLHIDCGLS